MNVQHYWSLYGRDYFMFMFSFFTALWETIKTEQIPITTVYKKLSASLPQRLHYLKSAKGKKQICMLKSASLWSCIEFNISILACCMRHCSLHSIGIENYRFSGELQYKSIPFFRLTVMKTDRSGFFLDDSAPLQWHMESWWENLKWCCGTY